MGRIRNLVRKVREDIVPLAAVVRDELKYQLDRARADRSVHSESAQQRTATSGVPASEVKSMSETTPRDEWAFAPMKQSAEAKTAAPADSVASAPAPAPAASADAPATAPVKITAQPSSTDPAVCRFTVEVPLFEERWIRIRNREMGHLSPLAARLFEIPQVVAVSFNGNVVLVTKSGPEPWPMIARQIGPAIRTHLASGQPALSQEPEELPKDSAQNLALFDRVKEVIETMINPGVAGHGGFVSLLGVESDTAYIQMGGGCHGCGMADVTLKQGIVQTIRSQVPEIIQVLDTTDHAAGQNPYYSPN